VASTRAVPFQADAGKYCPLTISKLIRNGVQCHTALLRVLEQFESQIPFVILVKEGHFMFVYKHDIDLL
jgi:sRNA-binding regulator protein Hfq